MAMVRISLKICGDRWHLQFERAVFVEKKLFPFPLASAYRVRGHFVPALPVRHDIVY